MPRPTTDLTDDYLQPHCTIVQRIEDGEPNVFLLDLWAFEYAERERGKQGHTKSPGTNVGSFLLTKEQVTRIQIACAEALGWTETKANWFKGKSLEADAIPETTE